jgi:hypothetical protein
MGERKDRSKVGLSKYAAEAAEQAAEHKDKLGIASKVKDVAGVQKTLWPEETHPELIDGAILLGTANVWDAKRGIVETGPDAGKRVDPETGEIVSGPGCKSKELPDAAS